MIYRDPIDAAPAIVETWNRAQRILILSHINPDGDAIGSMLALWHMFQAQGKIPIALASSHIPNFTRNLPGIDYVQIYDRGMSLPTADIVCLVDVSNLERTGPIHEDHAATLATHPLIIIDHHTTNTGEGLINLVDSQSASCTELVYRLFIALGISITPDIATCLLMGTITDTQSFQTSSTNAQTLHAAADMLCAGADHQSIIQATYFAIPYSTTQLIGISLSQLCRDRDLAWTHVTQEMMVKTGAEDAASDVVVNHLQRIEGIRLCVLFKERQNGETKISLRSKLGIDVAAIAKTWGGGGHKQAAGATLRMSPQAAELEVLPILRATLTSL